MNNTKLEQIHSTLAFDRDESKAKMYGLNKTEHGFDFKLIKDHGDIYSLIEDVGMDKLHSAFSYLTIITYGWAAPLNQETGECDTAPSQSPERRRVRLTITISRSESNIVGSSLEIDGEEDIVFEEGSAGSGPLIESFMSLVD